MEGKYTVRFGSQEVVGKMLELLAEQHKASAQADEEVDEEFDDWLWIDDTAAPDSDPVLSVYRYRLAQALLAANGVEVGLYCAETAIEEGGGLIVHYWD